MIPDVQADSTCGVAEHGRLAPSLDDHLGGDADEGSDAFVSEVTSEASTAASGSPLGPEVLFRLIEGGNEEDALDVLERAEMSDLTVRNAVGSNVFHQAVWKGLLALCSAMMGNSGLDINARDVLGWTALHLAASHGHTEICRALLDNARFEAVNVRDSCGATALHEASGAGHLETCLVLLRHQRFNQADAVDHRGETALHRAADGSHADVCRALLAHPDFSAVSVRNAAGATALACVQSEHVRQVFHACWPPAAGERSQAQACAGTVDDG